LIIENTGLASIITFIPDYSIHPAGETMVKNEIAEDLSEQETELLSRAPEVLDAQRSAGLEGLVGGLDAVIINIERDRLLPATRELLRYTGHTCDEAFYDPAASTFILSCAGSASLILRSRNSGYNPFERFNTAPVAGTLPNTRLETLVFTTPDIREYVAIQKERGVAFLTDTPVKLRHGLFIQTLPSQFTGNSLGFVEWHGDDHRSYLPASGITEEPLLPKPPSGFQTSILVLDHAATRVRAQERNAAILEFLQLTNYHYDFAVYVKSLNSITSVARRTKDDFAMVFTSGIMPDTGDGASGPTEKFIRNYGTRVHHIAFRTERIVETVAALKDDGMEFLLDLVGSPQRGSGRSSPYRLRTRCLSPSISSGMEILTGSSRKATWRS
jgi:hypothetical protein